ncbi:alanyl-tRNA editing protein [Oceanibacterium hippocampi]|uniref:Alanine--tRNA ligase n=1 Tax=Oceanibacterium hippocampi TaxID=745714 RepID=A0A1Y5SWE6_9PROT|nr:alanyl-tRNA editing protein [Oceanibacterium hippocampi]SLN49980.1 Alanine--tRNA ligase [Oceanibacterium hippocampi]
MTEDLFRADSYLRSCEATVTAVNERGGIVLDRTVFYPTGGGQPGDTGRLRLGDGREIRIVTTVKGDSPTEIVHVPAEGETAPGVGATVTAEIDWEPRHRLMRMHTCLHLLSAVMPYPVTGGQVSDGKGRLDFDLPELETGKEEISEALNRLIAGAHPVTADSISDAELDARPELVKTMSVQPPRGVGRVRLIRVADLDLQPCGGTHVANTAEIGPVEVRKIEKKGRQNRRVTVVFADPSPSA